MTALRDWLGLWLVRLGARLLTDGAAARLLARDDDARPLPPPRR
jgi:hypothetical protein